MKIFNLDRIVLTHWSEDEDLRRIQKRAPYLLRGCKPGEGVLVTNSRLGKYGERFRIVVRDKSGAVWVLMPPRQAGLESIFLKVHDFLAQAF